MRDADRQVLDLDDPEQLAEAASLGAIGPIEVSPLQFARLGQVHTELLAAQRSTADAAQATVLELEAAHAEIAMLRTLNANLRSLVTTGKLREIGGPASIGGPEASDLMVVTAHALAPDRAGVIGLLLSATVNACLQHAEQPLAALRAGSQVFDAALRDLEARLGRAPAAARVPS